LSGEDFVKRFPRLACVYSALTFALIASGCQSVALMPRPDEKRGPGVERREPDVERRESEPGTVIERGAIKEEIVGTLERMDRTKNEIRLRTTEAKVIVIKYDLMTRVYTRELEVGIDTLRPRDLILVRVSKTSRGEQHAELIRLNDRDESASKRD
jgi:hypothetical protein